MTKKISIGITLILIIISIIISSAASLFIVFNTYSNLLVDLPQRADQYLKLGELDELVRSEYYGSIDSASVDNALASGYINGLNDNDSYYVTADDIDSFNNFINGKSEGIGLNVYYDYSGSFLIVSYVYPDSPAHNADIEAGNVITSVNGKIITEDNFESLTDILCSSFNQKIEITVQKSSESSDGRTVDFTTGYEMTSCSYSVNDGTGYIRLNAFYESTYSSFREALDYMSSNKISSVILDLRNASGANYNEAAKIIDCIVPVGNEGTGAIFTATNFNGDTISKYSSDSVASNLSFAVLVNTRTSAAAELIACDLKDFGKAVLVGEKTAGNGTMQKLFELNDGGYVFLTVAEIQPYISDTFNKVGITPDIIIETSESFKNNIGNSDLSEDEQYNAALKYLTGK